MMTGLILRRWAPGAILLAMLVAIAASVVFNHGGPSAALGDGPSLEERVFALEERVSILEGTPAAPSTPSPTTTPSTGLPGPVRIHSAVPGPDYIDLAWQPPADTGGHPLSGYVLRVRAASTGSARYRIVGIQREMRVENLSGTYHLSLHAYTVAGAGPWSAVFTASTNAPALTPTPTPTLAPSPTPQPTPAPSWDDICDSPFAPLLPECQ